MRVVVIAIISIWLHELGHAAACAVTGDRLGSRRWSWKPLVNLDPIFSFLVPVVVSLLSGGAVAAGMGRPFLLERYNWRILAAGPAVNVMLMLVAYALGFYDVARINAMLAVVNLLPIPPLDGWAIYQHFSLRAITRKRIKQMIEEPPRIR